MLLTMEWGRLIVWSHEKGSTYIAISKTCW